MNAKETCGKTRYDDEYEAGKRLKELRARAEKNGHRGPVRYYEHWVCGGFHLTSQPDNSEREVREWKIAS
jgi:hypothetical protein